MRKLVVGEFISLDGVVEAPEKWHFPYVDQGMTDVLADLNGQADTMLLGRVTYETFAAAFANATPGDPAGDQMNAFSRVVVTSTLKKLEWAGSTVLTGDVVEGVAALKEQPGRAILVTGSTTLVRALLRAGLVDELNLLVHPIVLGKGDRLFDDLDQTIPLRLESSAAFGSGVVHAVYRKG